MPRFFVFNFYIMVGRYLLLFRWYKKRCGTNKAANQLRVLYFWFFFFVRSLLHQRNIKPLFCLWIFVFRFSAYVSSFRNPIIQQIFINCWTATSMVRRPGLNGRSLLLRFLINFNIHLQQINKDHSEWN